MNDFEKSGEEPPYKVPFAKEHYEFFTRQSITNPADVESVPGPNGEYNSVNAMCQHAAATKAFGLFGINWGLRKLETREVEVPGTEAPLRLVARAEFFFPNPNGSGEGSFPITVSVPIITETVLTEKVYTGKGKQFRKEPILDENGKVQIQRKTAGNPWKNAETSLVKKALSKIGFNADLYMGKFSAGKTSQPRGSYVENAASHHRALRVERLADLEKRLAQFSTVKALNKFFHTDPWYNMDNEAKALFTARKKALDKMNQLGAEEKTPEPKTEPQVKPKAEEKTPEPKAKPKAEEKRPEPKKAKLSTAEDKLIREINLCPTIRRLKALYTSNPVFKQKHYVEIFRNRKMAILKMEAFSVKQLLATLNLERFEKYQNSYSERFPERFQEPQIKQVFVDKKNDLLTTRREKKEDPSAPADKFENV